MLKTLSHGVLAGAVGTAVMTAYQLLVARVKGEPLATPVPHRWADAPPPAQVAKKAADTVGEGRRFTREDVPVLTNTMHWLYGIGWGAAYAALARDRTAKSLPVGLIFGLGVWAAAYAELVPLGIYKPPWKYPPAELALDGSYHLVYGLVVARTFAALN